MNGAESEPRGRSGQGSEHGQSGLGVSSQTTSVDNSIDEDSADDSAQAESVQSPTASVASDLRVQEESEVLVSPHGSDANGLLVNASGTTDPAASIRSLTTVPFLRVTIPCATFPDSDTSIPTPFHLNPMRFGHITAKAAVFEADATVLAATRYRLQPVSFTRGSHQRQQLAQHVDEYADDIEAMESFLEGSPRMIQVLPLHSAGLGNVQSPSRGDPISWLASLYPCAMKLMASWGYAEGESLGSTMRVIPSELKPKDRSGIFLPCKPCCCHVVIRTTSGVMMTR